MRMHGPERWYRHCYSRDELRIWADKIIASGAQRAWVYFNNDNNAYAIGNAKTMRKLLASSRHRQRPRSAKVGKAGATVDAWGNP